MVYVCQCVLVWLMICVGVDVVVGMYFYVCQDIEMIDGKLVIYSLGNFVFDGFSDVDNNIGFILWMMVIVNGVSSW